MRSWRLWLLWLVLLDACSTLTTVNIYKEPKGAHLTVTCRSNADVKGTRRVFCKNDCEEEDVLVQTSGRRETNGRYSIGHEKKGSPPQDIIRVTISNLTLNDSGRYRCFWDRSVGGSFSEFWIDVTDSLEEKSKCVVSVTAGEDLSISCSFTEPGKDKTFCRGICSEEDILVAVTGDEGKSGRYNIEYKKYADDLNYVDVTIRNVSVADSGAYRIGLGRKYGEFWIDVAPASPSGVPATVRPSAVPSSGAPVMVRPSGAAPEQEPSVRSVGAPETQNLVLILGLVLICVNVIVTGTILTIGCRRCTVRGTGTGGRHDPEKEHENCPESERIYEDLCLEEMEPTYIHLN